MAKQARFRLARRVLFGLAIGTLVFGGPTLLFWYLVGMACLFCDALTQKG